MNEQEHKIVESMEKYGGSFVQSLAECFHRADPYNFKRLKLHLKIIGMNMNDL
jgi:pyruvate/2-oxoacid:ferredoxin oxidoreductase beta subunit